MTIYGYKHIDPDFASKAHLFISYDIDNSEFGFPISMTREEESENSTGIFTSGITSAWNCVIAHQKIRKSETQILITQENSGQTIAKIIGVDEHIYHLIFGKETFVAVINEDNITYFQDGVIVVVCREPEEDAPKNEFLSTGDNPCWEFVFYGAIGDSETQLALLFRVILDSIR